MHSFGYVLLTFVLILSFRTPMIFSVLIATKTLFFGLILHRVYCPHDKKTSNIDNRQKTFNHPSTFKLKLLFLHDSTYSFSG